MDIGAVLRRAREERGLSLDQLSRVTKISRGILRAIEHNEIDRLPGSIFTRGFLRAYAREVGLDAEDTVKQYLAQFEPRSDDVPAAPTGGKYTRPALTRALTRWVTRAIRSETDLDEEEGRAAFARLVVAGLVLAVGFAVYSAFDGSPSPSTVLPQRAVIATSGSHDANAFTARRPDVIHLDIRTQRPCWVSATADGARVAYQLMQAGERQMIEAHDAIVLRIGDPAAFTFLINEMPGRPIGRAGEAVTVRITTRNYRDFLSPSPGRDVRASVRPRTSRAGHT